MFGSANSFRPNFTKPLKTFLWNFFLQIFFHKDHENFFVSPPNESLLLFFCKRLVPFFKWTLAAVLLRFSEILPGFLMSNFLGERFHPLHPAYYTTGHLGGCIGSFRRADVCSQQ